MPLNWNLNGQGPNQLPGSVFTAALGTAVAFSAGLAVAYTGLVIANPATPRGAVPVKLVPLRVNLVPTAAVSGTVAWGLVKLTGQGTASNGGVSALSGVVFASGLAGTVAINVSPGAGGYVGAGSSVAQVGGTFSVINGTAAGTGANTLYWQEMLGNVNSGTGAASVPIDLPGFTSVLPGETVAISPVLAVTGLASITWLETPLNSGA
jgi:hypothetical protein